jgi:hypothetical protein
MHPNGFNTSSLVQKQYSNINDLLYDASENPRSVLAISNLGNQLDLFAKCGEPTMVLRVLKAIGAQCPRELEASDFLESLLASLRNGPLFNQCFGNMGDVTSVASFMQTCCPMDQLAI